LLMGNSSSWPRDCLDAPHSRAAGLVNEDAPFRLAGQDSDTDGCA
jgi:hypothetical protein